MSEEFNREEHLANVMPSTAQIEAVEPRKCTCMVSGVKDDPKITDGEKLVLLGEDPCVFCNQGNHDACTTCTMRWLDKTEDRFERDIDFARRMKLAATINNMSTKLQTTLWHDSICQCADGVLGQKNCAGCENGVHKHCRPRPQTVVKCSATPTTSEENTPEVSPVRQTEATPMLFKRGDESRTGTSTASISPATSAKFDVAACNLNNPTGTAVEDVVFIPDVDRFKWLADKEPLYPTTAVVSQHLGCANCLRTFGSDHPKNHGYYFENTIGTKTECLCLGDAIDMCLIDNEKARCAICGLSRTGDCEYVSYGTYIGRFNLYVHPMCHASTHRKCEFCKKIILMFDMYSIDVGYGVKRMHLACAQKCKKMLDAKVENTVSREAKWAFLTSFTEWNADVQIADIKGKQPGLSLEGAKTLALARFEDSWKTQRDKIPLKDGLSLADPSFRVQIEAAGLHDYYFVDPFKKTLTVTKDFDFFAFISFVIDLWNGDVDNVEREAKFKEYLASRLIGTGAASVVSLFIGMYRGWKPVLVQEAKTPEHPLITHIKVAVAALSVAGAGFALVSAGVEATANLVTVSRSFLMFLDVIDKLGREEKKDVGDLSLNKHIDTLASLASAGDVNEFVATYAKQSNEFKELYPFRRDQAEHVQVKISNDYRALLIQNMEMIKHGEALSILAPLRNVSKFVWTGICKAAESVWKLAKDPTTYAAAGIAAMMVVFGEWVGGKLYEWYYSDKTVRPKYLAIRGRDGEKFYSYPTPMPESETKLTPIDPTVRVKYAPPMEDEKAILFGQLPDLVQEVKKGKNKRSRGAPRVQMAEYETWLGFKQKIKDGEILSGNAKARFDYLNHKAKYEGLWSAEKGKWNTLSKQWEWPNGRGAVVDRDERIDAYADEAEHVAGDDDELDEEREQIRQEEEERVRNDGYVSEAKYPVRGCIHWSNCPSLAAGLVRTGAEKPCHIYCGGPECRHRDDCHPVGHNPATFQIRQEVKTQSPEWMQALDPKTVKVAPEWVSNLSEHQNFQAVADLQKSWLDLLDAKVKTVPVVEAAKAKPQEEKAQQKKVVKIAEQKPPVPEAQVAKNGMKLSKTPCKYGDNCGYNRRGTCMFSHTARQVEAAKTKAPPKSGPPAVEKNEGEAKKILKREANVRAEEAPPPLKRLDVGELRKEASVKTAAQAVDAAYLPSRVDWIAFNQVSKFDSNKDALWDVYVKKGGVVTLYKRKGQMYRQGDKYRFVYRVTTKPEPVVFTRDLDVVVEKDTDGKRWFLWGVKLSDPELKNAHPYVLAAVNQLSGKTLPLGNNDAPKQEAASRNGMAPDPYKSCVFMVYNQDGQDVGVGARAGAYGITAKHVVTAAQAHGKVFIDIATDRIEVSAFTFYEYDLAVFKWPSKPSFQAITSATIIGDTMADMLRERQKVACFAQYVDKNNKRQSATSTGITDLYDETNMKVRADYGTDGPGSSGSPVFVEVNPGVWHLAGIHVEACQNSKRNWFAMIRPSMRKALNYQSPPPSK